MMQRIDPRMPVNWQHPLTAGLVEWWKVMPAFRGGQQLTGLAKRHRGTLQGGVTWTSAKGRRGGLGALKFIGGSSTRVVVSPTPYGTIPITIACWMQNDTLDLGQFALMIADSSVAAHWFTLQPHPTRGWEYHARSGGAAFDSTNFAVAGGGTIDTAWHFVVGGSHTTTDHRLSVDGALVDADTNSANPLGLDTLSCGQSSDATPSGSFDGRLDDVMLYNRALSDTEIAALYHLTQRRDNPMLRFVREPVFYSLPSVVVPPGGGRWAYQPLFRPRRR